MYRGRVKEEGFTLVELLVVIGIITVLIGILLPALAAARGLSRFTACRSTARQLMMATLTEADAKKGVIPSALDSYLLMPLEVTIECPEDPSPGFVPASVSMANLGSGTTGSAVATANTSSQTLAKSTVAAKEKEDAEDPKDDENDNEDPGKGGKGSQPNVTGIYSSYVLSPELNAYKIRVGDIAEPARKTLNYEGFADSAGAGTWNAYGSIGGQVWFDGTNTTITHIPGNNYQAAASMTIPVASLSSHLAHGDPVGNATITSPTYGSTTTSVGIKPFNTMGADFVKRHFTSRQQGTMTFVDGHTEGKSAVTSKMLIYPNGKP